MPKRKRTDYEHPSIATYTDDTIEEEEEGQEEGVEESTRSIAIHQKTIEQKIHHSRILLKRALKTAKGFEQQKLGKRIKAARKGRLPAAAKVKVKSKDGAKKEDEVEERLEKEIEALKHVDLGELATRHLNKVLLKNRALSSSRYFPPEIAREVEEQSKAAPTGPAANVCARMLNANPVKESMKEILGNIARFLGVESGVEDGGKPNKETEKSTTRVTELKAVIHGTDTKFQRNEDSEDDLEAGSKDDSEDAVIHPSMLKSLATKYLRNAGTISSDESEDEDEDEDNLDGRIAWSSEDEGEDSEEDISGSEDDRPRGRSMSITPIPEDQLRQIEALENEDFDIDLSDEEVESDADVASPPPPEKPRKSKDKKQVLLAPEPASTGPIKSSSFLPTLMTGYISGSDSDASSDTSTKNKSKKSKKGPPEKKIRKNRMGQQARRALALKMYGTGANHIKKEKEEKEAKVKEKEERKKAWEEKQTKPVHVSWQLKKKEKDEKDKIVKDIMSGKNGGVGKKIVFD